MSSKGVVWDLCSGLGGWSEAFVQAGWDVIRIENNPELIGVTHTHDFDVLNYWDWIDGFPDPDIILASPPCLEFSTAYHSPRSVAARAGIDYEPDLSILHACKEIIDAKRPKWWIIENVSGAAKYFESVLGKQRQIIGPYHLWGNFPFLPILQDIKPKDSIAGNAHLASNKRALIPFELSFNLLTSWREQTSLEDFI